MTTMSARFFRLHLPIALGLWLAAAAQYFWGAPYLERLPANYTAETTYAAKCRSRQSPTAPLEEYETITRRHDQTLNSVAGSAIIQGDIHWVTPAGVVMFEILSLYGVDRRTRENLPGYGNEERTGLYLFPPDTEKKEYRQWDPMYAGPRTVTFERTEQLDGMEVYVFNFVADGIDETSGYVALPDVPERYRAITYGKGKVSVEPHSGVVVRWEDEGISYFVEPKTGERVAEVFQWSDQFTPETQAEQLRLAHARLRHHLVLEVYLPAALIAAGVLWLAVAAVYDRRTRRRTSERLPADSAVMDRRYSSEVAS
ncbi:MAG: DUF3068 domain-containing protein [Chthoniobacterales bacterium]|nr:DUF3068 domain-containing protein [Chthoniobacterales bacterium]